MFIPDPGSWFLPIPDPGSRIPDPKTTTKERDEKKFVFKPFFCYKFHKIENYFILEMLKKIFLPNFQRIEEFLSKKIVNKLSKIRFWDPGSGIRDPGSEIRDPRSGIRDQGSEIRDPRSGIRDPGSGIRKKTIPDPGAKKSHFNIYNLTNHDTV
jgi:hypothetical protein